MPIIVYETFVLRKTSDEIKYNPSRGHIISDYIHVGLVGTITIFAYQNVEDDLMIFFYKCIGGLYLFLLIIKGYYDKNLPLNKIYIKEIFIGAIPIYIACMIFPNLVNNMISHMLLDGLEWLYLTPYVGLISKILGAFFVSGTIWLGIKALINLTKEKGLLSQKD